MANIKSAIKRAELAKVRTRRNASIKSEIKTLTRKAETTATAGDGNQTTAALNRALSAIDKAATKGVLHKRTAARKKSRLAKRLNKLQAAQNATA